MPSTQKCLIILNLLFLLVFTGPKLHAQDYSEQDFISATATIIEQQKPKADKENTVWPKLDLYRRPIILKLPGEHYFAFNLFTLDSHWQEYQPAGKTLQVGTWPVYHSDEDHWDLGKQVMNNDFTIEGQHAFFLAVSSLHPGSFFVWLHEFFHSYQTWMFSKRLKVKNTESSAHPLLSKLTPYAIWIMALEDELALEFLDMRDPETLRNLVALLQERQKIMPPSAFEYEDSVQSSEGTANYVAVALLEEYAELVPDFDPIKQWQLDRQHFGPDFAIVQRVLYWRHYLLGNALAYGLDDLQSNSWKSDVEKNKRSILDSLNARITWGSNFQNSGFNEQTWRVAAVKSKYDADLQIREHMQNALSEQQIANQQAMQAYANEPGIEVTLALTEKNNCHGGWSPRPIPIMLDGTPIDLLPVIFLENGTVLNTGVTGKLECFTPQASSVKTLEMEFDNLRFQISSNDDELEKFKRFKFSGDTELEFQHQGTATKTTFAQMAEKKGTMLHADRLTWNSSDHKTTRGEMNNSDITVEVSDTKAITIRFASLPWQHFIADSLSQSQVQAWLKNFSLPTAIFALLTPMDEKLQILRRALPTPEQVTFLLNENTTGIDLIVLHPKSEKLLELRSSSKLRSLLEPIQQLLHEQNIAATVTTGIDYPWAQEIETLDQVSQVPICTIHLPYS